jgi:integrase
MTAGNGKGMSTQKIAIVELEVQERILKACKPKEYIGVYLMLKFGMHPKDLVRKERLAFDGVWLSWKRAKTGRPRRFPISEDVRPKLAKWLATTTKKTRQAYWYTCKIVGLRVGIPNLSPMTLRHTACLNWIREEQAKGRTDVIDYVSVLMGATPDAVRRNYIDFEQYAALTPAKPANVTTSSTSLPSIFAAVHALEEKVRSLEKKPKKPLASDATAQ